MAGSIGSSIHLSNVRLENSVDVPIPSEGKFRNSCIHSTAQTILQFLKLGYDAIEITGCWANINASGAAHAIHSHPNNFLSGIYYVSTHPGADSVNFHDPRPQTSISFNMMFSLYGERLSGPLWGSAVDTLLGE